jgi:2-C-methyl-D-erythritol 4-phosphate cytidylyltransferase
VTVWAVVVAAGRGERFGGPKHRALVAGKAVLAWSIAAARTVADGVVLVVPPAEAGAAHEGADCVVAGGDTRSASVRAGLRAVPADAEIIVVHDAARPAASPDLFRSVVDAVRSGADGAVPGLAVTDTVKVVEEGRVVDTPAREKLVAVQTPQAFAAGALRAAHERGGNATDDAALVERGGGRVVVVPGEATNLKLTGPADLDRLAEVLGRASEAGQ